MAGVFKRGGPKAKGNYIAWWFDHNGKRVTKSSRTTDKKSAELIAHKYEAEAALRREGVIDATLDAISRESQRTIEDHLADFENKMRAESRSEGHINDTLYQIRGIVEHAGFSKAADISADGVNRCAGHLQDKGRSARTIQAYLTAIKSFTSWLAKHHKLQRDPLASVKKPNPESDRRSKRRMLLPEEWRRLVAVTKTGPKRCGMSGSERALVYRTAIQTGLRSSELRSLTRGLLYLDSNPPYIVCRAESTKDGKEARQYIDPALAADLEAHITTLPPKAKLFKLPHGANMALMLRNDLADAREQWLSEAKGDAQEYAQREECDFLRAENDEGEVIVFHSLRHTCGAWLAKSGAYPNVVQSVMRHKDIKLTLDTYGHLFPGQEADAVRRSWQVMGDSPERRAAYAQQTGRLSVRSVAMGCDEGQEDRAQKKTPKSLNRSDLGEQMQPIANVCEVPSPGFEPGLTDPESVVLPLH